MLTAGQLSHLSQKYLPQWLDQPLRDLAHRRGRRSFSQEGEDLILGRYFESRRTGFYVDVGAHHPFRFSNTYFFFLQGWRGLNIDASPGAMARFRRFRPGDINLEMGVGERSTNIPFYMFDEPALNTFDSDLANERNRPPRQIVRTVNLPVEPLGTILDKNLPPQQRIDFLSIDVEGKDLEVLRSNNWQAFRPEIVVVETMSENIDALSHSPHHQFMLACGYAALAKSIHSSFYIDMEKASS